MADASAAAGSAPVTVVIAGMRFGYPHGLGATARVRAYARGLVESGARVEVVSLLTPDPEGPGANVDAAGVYEGVAFSYACGTRRRAESFLGRRLLEAKVPVVLWVKARRAFRSAPGAKAILAYTDQPIWITFMALLARSSGAVCMVELCELPLLYERGTLRPVVKRWFQDVVAYRLVDGFLAISSFLEAFAGQHTRGRAASLRVPILVTAADFECSDAAADVSERQQIVYVGDLSHAGEIADLLEAFALLAPTHPAAVLRLVGGASPERIDEVEARADELGIGDRVELVGQVQRARLPELLCDATMQVLLRRDGLFSRAGFPTKLGEYLASGRPVVVTATGDIPDYLTDGTDAYLAPPGDPRLFAERMAYVLDHPEEARGVGRRGRQLARDEFDYRRHGPRMARFVRDLAAARAMKVSRPALDSLRGGSWRT